VEVLRHAALKVVNPATTRLAEAVPQPESRTEGGGIAKGILGASFDTFVLGLACLSALNRFACSFVLIAGPGGDGFCCYFGRGKQLIMLRIIKVRVMIKDEGFTQRSGAALVKTRY